MIDDAKDAITFAKQAGSFEVFTENSLYRKAIIMSIINIGELARRLPEDFKSTYSEIPWRRIIGMRDVAAHGYHIIDDKIVWNVVAEAIPDLLFFLETIVKEEPSG
jgi:uncharacterized protein with HEPN domain